MNEKDRNADRFSPEINDSAGFAAVPIEQASGGAARGRRGAASSP